MGKCCGRILGRNAWGNVQELCSGTFLWGLIYHGDTSGGIVRGGCPDHQAKLQVSMCSSYDSAHPGEHTDSDTLSHRYTDRQLLNGYNIL